MLRIGVDLRLLEISLKRGMGRYTLQQLHAVIPHTPDNHYVLFTLHPIPASLAPLGDYPNVTIDSGFKRYNIRIFRPIPALAGAVTRALERAMYRHALDLLHIPMLFNFIQPIPTPIRHCPVLITLYDLIPRHFPEHFHWMPIEKFEYDRGIAYLPTATHLITISDATSADATALLGYPPARMTTAYPVVDSAFRADAPLAPADAVWQRLGMDAPKRYMFTVSDHFYTKNLHTLIHAYVALPPHIRAECPLVVTFDIQPHARAEFLALCQKFGVAPQVVFTGRVSESELVALYRGAHVCIYPSRYEGFGYPIVEAMACGTPVITTTASSLPEVGGDAVLLVDSDDASGMADAMARLYADEALRADLIARGYAQVARFNVDELARQTAHAYQRAVADGHPPATQMLPPSPPHWRMLLALWGIFTGVYYRLRDGRQG